MQNILKHVGFKAVIVTIAAFLALYGISWAATTVGVGIDVDNGTISVTDGGFGTSYFHADAAATQGDASGWSPDPGGYAGIWLEGYDDDDGEAGGFFANTETAAVWSPGDTDFIFGVYDEDDLPTTTPRFGVTADGGIWVGGNASSPDHVSEPMGDGEAFIESDMEVDGSTYLDGTLFIGDGSYGIDQFYSGSASLDFASTDDGDCASDLTITVTNAAVGDTVVATPETPNAGWVWSAYVSAADTVTVRYCNMSGSTVDPASGTWRADVWQHFSP